MVSEHFVLRRISYFGPDVSALGIFLFVCHIDVNIQKRLVSCKMGRGVDELVLYIVGKIGGMNNRVFVLLKSKFC